MASRQVRLGERAQILPAGEASTCGIGDTGAKKEEYASTLRNFRLCLGITCAWEGDGYMADQSERHYNDIDWVVNHLYASGVYAGLQTFDGGIRVWICDRHYCKWADHSILTARLHHSDLIESWTAEAALWLHQQALRLFPGSDYAGRNTG